MLFRRRRTERTATAGGEVDPAGFPGEATVFVALMHDLAPELVLDRSPASVGDLEAFLAARFDDGQHAPDSLQVGVGCYLGEVIRRAAGGTWTAEGTLEGLGPVTEAFPLARARARFERGPSEHLGIYVETVLRYAARSQQE